MKLYYITRVNIPSKAAQSVQIMSMCKAFYKVLKGEFKLIAPYNSNNSALETEFEWIRVKIRTRFKYMEMLLRSIMIFFRDRPTHIYTRDIVIAFVFSFFNVKVAYEAHKEPRTKTAYILLKFLRHKKNFLLVTISKALYDYYTKFGFKKHKLFYYHDGVFIEKYDKLRSVPKYVLRQELGLPVERLIVMHTGSLYDGRGAELFEVIIKHFPDIYFVHVGGRQDDVSRWRAYYKHYDNILIIGHQEPDRLVKYQMSADLLFYPMTRRTDTWWCASPMKVFEYMATGIPILASNIGSVGEVLTDENAIIFDPEKENSIIEGVKFFIRNRDTSLRLAANALNDVRCNYTWEKRARSILRFLNIG